MKQRHRKTIHPAVRRNRPLRVFHMPPSAGAMARLVSRSYRRNTQGQAAALARMFRSYRAAMQYRRLTRHALFGTTRGLMRVLPFMQLARSVDSRGFSMREHERFIRNMAMVISAICDSVKSMPSNNIEPTNTDNE